MSDKTSEVVDPGFGPPAGQDSNEADEQQATDSDTGEEASTVSGSGNDETRASEEESQSQIPGDPRPVNEEQPPTKEQY